MGQFNLETFRKPVSLGVLFLLGAWSIYLVVENVFFYLDADLARRSLSPSESVQDACGRPLPVPGQALPRANCLAASTTINPNKLISAPTTRLNLELQGVFLSDAPAPQAQSSPNAARTANCISLVTNYPGTVSYIRLNPITSSCAAVQGSRSYSLSRSA